MKFQYNMTHHDTITRYKLHSHMYMYISKASSRFRFVFVIHMTNPFTSFAALLLNDVILFRFASIV